MSRNLELKAAVVSLSEAVTIAQRLGARHAGTFRQKDTFLVMGGRRLKIREQQGEPPELIYYRRADAGRRSGRWSDFIRVPLRSPTWLLRAGNFDPADRVVVRKERTVFIHRNARIHLDSVRGLGAFIEFEVMLERGRGQAAALLEELVNAFGIVPGRIVGRAYADLIGERLQR